MALFDTPAACKPGIADAPLEVMLANMLHFHRLAESAEKALTELSADKIADMKPDEQFKFLLAEVKKAAGLRNLAQECARDAAPYIHPRLALIEQSVTGEMKVQYAISDQPLTPEEWNKQYAGTA